MKIDKSNVNQFIKGPILDCSGRGVTSIESIPESITKLYCYGNKLTSLPKLPNGLNYLNCHNNQLTSLPILPNRLIELYCHNNQLTSLPILPNLKYLNFHNNPLIDKTYPLSNWIKQHNRSITIKQLLNDNR